MKHLLLSLIALFTSPVFGQSYFEFTGGPLYPDSTKFATIQSMTYHEGKIFAASNHAGMYVFNDDSWYPLNQGLHNTELFSVSSSPNGDLYSSGYLGVYMLASDDISWVRIRNTGDFAKVKCTDTNTIITCDEGPPRISTNKGQKWTSLLTNFSSDFSYDVIYDQNIKSFIIGCYNALISTADTGKSQNLLITGDAFRSVYRTGDVLLAGARANIYRSITNGITWDTVFRTEKITLGAVYSIVENSKGTLFAGGHFGVVTSRDRGASWFYPDDSAKYMNVRSLCMTPDDNLFVGTINKGIWKSKQSTGVYNPITSSYSKQNLISYPNPTQKRISVLLPFQTTDEVNVLIKNEIGDVVRDFEYDMSEKEIRIDVSKLSVGAYFVSVTKTGFFETTKIIVVK